MILSKCRDLNSNNSNNNHALNDIISRAFSSAGVPAVKKPTGLSRSDGRRPDGLILIPWQNGESLTWDVTVATTLADSYVNASANSAGGAAEMAASRKSAKYADLSASYIFQPIALETLGPMNSSAMEFFTVLVSDERERGGGAFFFSRYPTQFCCTRVSLESTIRTSSSSRFFRFNFFSF